MTSSVGLSFRIKLSTLTVERIKGNKILSALNRQVYRTKLRDLQATAKILVRHLKIATIDANRQKNCIKKQLSRTWGKKPPQKRYSIKFCYFKHATIDIALINNQNIYYSRITHKT